MDHFNATIKDGELVNTRRGLQVSRQKFNGLSFVNAYPQQQTSVTWSSRSRRLPQDRRGKHGQQQFQHQQRQFKFIDKSSSIIPLSQKQKTAGTVEFVSESESTSNGSNYQQRSPMAMAHNDGNTARAKSKQQRKRAPTVPAAASHVSSSSYLTSSSRSRGSSSHTASPSSSSLHTTSAGSTPGSELCHYQHTPYSSPTLCGRLPPAGITNEEWLLFHHDLANTFPRMYYPYDDILTHNPLSTTDQVLSSEFYDMVSKDAAAIYSVLMCAAVVIEGRGGRGEKEGRATTVPTEEPRGFAYYISKICSTLNEKFGRLQRDQIGDGSVVVDQVTVFCISSLALMGVSFFSLASLYNPSVFVPISP